MRIFLILLVLVSSFSVYAEDLKPSGAKWSKKAPNEMDWYDAKKYCAYLNENGHFDWRLPTISEL